jgi:hypothetical protein
MSKTEKEIAYLRDLVIDEGWTQRFTDILDENFKVAGKADILYVNAGTGNHALALKQKMRKKVPLHGVVETNELLTIAEAKAAASDKDVTFSTGLPGDTYEVVLADASFTPPGELKDLVEKITPLSENQVFFFLPTAGSFGEVYSLLWESLYNAGLLDKGAEVERLITQLPTVSDAEQIAAGAGLANVTAITKIEDFDFATSKEFLESPLVADFLLPGWFGFLTEKESKQVRKHLARAIDEEGDDLTFRFSVKATLVSGEKGAAIQA